MIELDERIDEILVEEGILKLDKLKEAWDLQRRTDKKMDEILLELRLVTKKDIDAAKAKRLGVEYFDLNDFEPKDPELLGAISKDLILKYSVLPIEKKGDSLIVAMKDPKDIFAMDDLRIATSLTIQPVYADGTDIDKLINRYYIEKKAGSGLRETAADAGESRAAELPGKSGDVPKKGQKPLRETDEGYTSRNKSKIGGLLINSGLITAEQLEKALEIQSAEGGRIGQVLVKAGYIEKKQLHEMLEKQLGTKHIELTQLNIPDEILGMVDEKLARRHKIVPVEKDGFTLKVAMSDPTNIFSIDDLRLATGFEIQPLLADEDEIDAILELRHSKGSLPADGRAKASKDRKTSRAIDFEEELKKVNEEIAIEITDDGVEENLDISDIQNAPIVKMVNLIFNKAVQNKASDIHIEPYEDCLLVRNRIDGQLVEIMNHDRKIHPALVARIKIISGLNIAEKRLPQDGRISLKVNSKDYDMRVSVLPTMFGEKVVIRLADKAGFNVKKQELGFSDDDLNKFDGILSHPHGIVLVTGPTGSGKSTTLYTALKELCKPNINILTVEDPVESTVKGVNQVQVNTKAGLTFAAALRSFLRQDPDIIMVGEIRDPETAEIAIRAAITGHLVLSTLHTNDAASSITRMIDMGAEPYLISSCVVGVIAQRLVRRLCTKCREEYEPPANEKDLLKLGENDGTKLFRPKGCPECNNTGYKGRIAIYEIMTITPEIVELISRNTPFNILKEAAVKNGMVTLRENCGRLVREGVTTLEEMLRVTYAQE